MKFDITEEQGEENFGVIWISVDGRLMTMWFNKYEEAKRHYFHLQNLSREPSFVIRIENKAVLK